MKTPAKIDNIVNFWKLLRMALKMFVNSDISVKISNM